MTRRAFTLMELLAVVSIVSILMAIIGHAVAGARRDAKKAACAFNLRQMGVGVQSYILDYDDMFPQSKGHTTERPQTDDNAGQIESPDFGSPLFRLGVYGSGIADCPADPDIDNNYCFSDFNSNADVNSYLVNGNFVWGLNGSRVRSYPQTVYIAERRNEEVNHVPPNCDVIYRTWYDPTTNPSAPQNDMDENTGAISTKRHMGAANYGFCDTHAAWKFFSQTWDQVNGVDWHTP